MILSSEELSMCKDEMELQFMAKKLDKKDWFGSSGIGILKNFDLLNCSEETSNCQAHCVLHNIQF